MARNPRSSITMVPPSDPPASVSMVTPQAINNNVVMGCNMLYVTPAVEGDTITGFVHDPGAGCILFVTNAAATNNLILANDNANSDAQNRILTTNGMDCVIAAGDTAMLGYDGTGQRWHTMKLPDSVPAGTMLMWGAVAAPANWLICNGASLLRSDYPALFKAIGTSFGAADGTHFTIPDMRQRFPLGKAASGTGDTLAATGGSVDHVHTVDPPNTTSAAPSSTIGNISLLGLGSAGSGTHTHDVNIAQFNSGSNNPPFLVVNFIIKT